MKKLTKKQLNGIFESYARYCTNVVQKAHRDAILYGIGIINITAKGDLIYVPYVKANRAKTK